jgi:glycosidase
MEPRFGAEEELRLLVAAAHERGIKVLLDVVYNHAGYGAKYEVDPQYAGWIRSEQPDCETDPLRCRVGGLPDFVTERPEVAEYVLEANIGLASRTGLDGFRLDTVKHIDHDFWQLHRARTRAELGEDFFLLGEVWGGSAQVLDPWFEGDELDAGFDFTFRGSCRDFIAGRMRTIAYSAYLDRRHRVRDGYHLAHYLSSHDEPLQLYEMGGDRDRFRLCVALQMTTLGIPVIFYGEEVARKGSVWPVNREDMPWGARDVKPGAGIERDEAMRAWYRALIEVRRANPALSRGRYAALHTDGDLLVFRKDDPGSDNAAIVAINRGTAAVELEVPAPAHWAAAVDGISGQPAVMADGRLRISLPALGARVYVTGGGEN